MENKALVQQINKELAVAIPEKISMEELYETLSVHINSLIQHNFQQLVSLLYRIDISETKIKSLLQNNTHSNAGNIIAALIIERQLQKITSREQFKNNSNDLNEAEKW